MMQRMARGAATASLALAATLAPTAADAADQLGKVDFPNSCSPAVQERLQRGVALLHSFYYSATQKAFEAVAAADPSCAIAAWRCATSSRRRRTATGRTRSR